MILFLIALIVTMCSSVYTYLDYRRKQQEKNLVITVTLLTMIWLIFSICAAIVTIISGISVFFHNVF